MLEPSIWSAARRLHTITQAATRTIHTIWGLCSFPPEEKRESSLRLPECVGNTTGLLLPRPVAPGRSRQRAHAQAKRQKPAGSQRQSIRRAGPAGERTHYKTAKP